MCHIESLKIIILLKVINNQENFKQLCCKNAKQINLIQTLGVQNDFIF